MVVVAWLIYQPELPSIPEIEVMIVGRLASTFVTLVAVAVFPALSVDLKLIAYTPSDKDRLDCQVFPSVDNSAVGQARTRIGTIHRNIHG